MNVSRLLLHLGAALALTACAGDGPTPPTSTDAVYVLVSANDQPLPALVHEEVLPEDGARIEVYAVADTIVLTANGRYSQRGVLRVYSDGQLVGRSTPGDHGVVTRADGALAFDSEYIENVAFDGSIDASGRLTVIQDLPRNGSTARYVFERR